MSEILSNICDDDIFTVVSPNKDVVITLNEILDKLDIIAKSNNIEDINEISTARFNTLLLNIGMLLIKPSRIYLNNHNGKSCSDYNIITILANVYVYICFIYNKGISLRGFSNFLGIGMIQTTNSIENMDNCLTKIQNFLKKSDNALQMSNARDSKQAILQLAYNNYVHGWNGDIKSNEIKASYKSLDDIRRDRLAMSDNVSADGVQ